MTQQSKIHSGIALRFAHISQNGNPIKRQAIQRGETKKRMSGVVSPLPLHQYRGADKSLAGPGRGNKLMFLFKLRKFPSAPCLAGKTDLMTARVSMLLKSRASLTCSRACFLPGRAISTPVLHTFYCQREWRIIFNSATCFGLYEHFLKMAVRPKHAALLTVCC